MTPKAGFAELVEGTEQGLTAHDFLSSRASSHRITEHCESDLSDFDLESFCRLKAIVSETGQLTVSLCMYPGLIREISP